MTFVRCFAPLLTIAALTAQTTVVVPCDLDNTLYQDLSGSISNGQGRSFYVGETGVGLARRTVLRFNIAGSLPAGAQVVAASLKMNITLTQDASPLPVDAHRVTASWGEGNSTASGGGGGGGAGGPAQANDATWMHRFYSATSWATPGGDFQPTPSFSFAMPTAGTFVVPASPGLVADVQAWRDNPAVNFGWLLKAQVENTIYTARRLDSRQSLTTANRPTLTVTYLLPGQKDTWGIGCPSWSGNFTFNFTGSMVGGQYAYLFHTNGPIAGIGANWFALQLNHPGVPLYPACNVYLPASSAAWIPGNLFLFDGGGVASSPWLVPAAYPGLYFMSQSVALDATSPVGLILSNAGVAVIQ